MEKAEKQAELESLGQSFGASQIALCADYRGLTVAQMTELRRGLRKVGSSGQVVKNTLARISVERSCKDADGAEVDKFKRVFEGPSFLVFGADDPISAAKLLAEFSKKHQPFKIKGAWFEGSFVDPAGVEMLAAMPSREELLAKLLAVISAPATQLVRLLQTPATQVTRVVEEQRKKLEGGGA